MAIDTNSVWTVQDGFLNQQLNYRWGDTERSLVSNSVLYLSRSENSVILCHKETFPAASAWLSCAHTLSDSGAPFQQKTGLHFQCCGSWAGKGMGHGEGHAQSPSLGQWGMDGSPQGGQWNMSERTEVTAWLTVKAGAPHFVGWACAGGEEGAPLLLCPLSTPKGLISASSPRGAGPGVESGPGALHLGRWFLVLLRAQTKPIRTQVIWLEINWPTSEPEKSSRFAADKIKIRNWID